MSLRTPASTRIVAPSKREYTSAFEEDVVPLFVLPQSLYTAAPKKPSKRQRGGAARHGSSSCAPGAKARRNAVPGLDALLSKRR